MSTRKDIDHTKKFCRDLTEELKGEATAGSGYTAKAAEARKLNHPASEMIATIYEMLAVQEASHKDALTKIAREVCPI